MSRARFLGLYFAAWIPAAALYSFLIYLQAGQGSAGGAIGGGVQSMLFAALLGLGAWRITRLLAERARPLGWVVASHLGLGFTYALLWTVAIIGTVWLAAPPSVLEAMLPAAGWMFFTGLLLYGFVAGIAHAVTVAARLRREREAVARAEALRARAELSAVRAQMRPHFLFNTLHSIAALVRTEPQAAEDALERLAGLLRRVLDANRGESDQVALGEEWETVREQLALEGLRYGDRLRVVTSIESDALDCAIPIFTLQPLVENAVRHGVATRTQPCTVEIIAGVQGDVLRMVVRDDGPGGDEAAVQRASGLGLRAVRQRLLALHGDRASVLVETSPGAGFAVTVRLPVVAAPSMSPAANAHSAVAS